MMKRRTVPRISETEWEVMRAVWAGHPVSAATILERLQATDASWHPKTAKTLLARLVKKGALGHAVVGRAYVYSPRVTEGECVAAAGDSFLQRVFGGALKPMLAHFVDREPLSAAELRELEEILRRKRSKE